MKPLNRIFILGTAALAYLVGCATPRVFSDYRVFPPGDAHNYSSGRKTFVSVNLQDSDGDCSIDRVSALEFEESGMRIRQLADIESAPGLYVRKPLRELIDRNADGSWDLERHATYLREVFIQFGAISKYDPVGDPNKDTHGFLGLTMDHCKQQR